MMRRYILVNTLFGYPMLDGRRFFTAKGAWRRASRLQFFMPQFTEVRKIL